MHRTLNDIIAMVNSRERTEWYVLTYENNPNGGGALAEPEDALDAYEVLERLREGIPDLTVFEPRSEHYARGEAFPTAIGAHVNLGPRWGSGEHGSRGVNIYANREIPVTARPQGEMKP